MAVRFLIVLGLPLACNGLVFEAVLVLCGRPPDNRRNLGLLEAVWALLSLVSSSLDHCVAGIVSDARGAIRLDA